jgi:regulator of sirC expression with transglutaminase-like and TPR domain
MRTDRARAANRAAFAQLVARPERELDLARGALLIAAAGRPQVDPEAALGELERLAQEVLTRSGTPLRTPGRWVDDADDLAALLEQVHEVLYRRAGFHAAGPATGTLPAHSLFDLVVSERVGLPISLAIVELEVGRRVGLPLHGIGLPGHFIIGGPGGLMLDPADDGRRLTRDDCQALIRRALGEPLLLRDGMLRPAGKREILSRMLRNLRIAQLVARDWPAALAAIELLEVLEPANAEHPRDRGLLLGRMGRFSDAVALLDAYLELDPDAPDAKDVRSASRIFGDRRN